MKKFKIIAVSFLISLAASCSLDILPDSSVSNDSYWKTQNDVEAAVNGIYTQMRNQLDSWKWIYWFEARSGNMAQGMTSCGIGSYIENEITPSLNDVSWSTLYNIVAQANAVINNAGRAEFHDTAVHDKLLSEAYFFRAWCYFQLVRLWGDVPKITNFISSLDDPQLYPERSPKDEIYQLVLDDIAKAGELNTEKSIESRNRVSRAAILMLQTEIYLWMYRVEKASDQYLAMAETAVDEVLEFPGLQMLGNYRDVFETENNSEIIFALYYDLLENTSQYGTLLCQSSTLVPEEYRNNPIPVNNSNNRIKFSDSFCSRYLDKTPGDTRASYICDEIESGGTVYRYTLKYQGEMNGNTRAFTTDTRMYRLAEAYMFKAEILALKGQDAEACSMLDKTVSRAYGNDRFYSAKALTGDDLMDAILDERMIEFAGECKSWFDLIRFGVVFERVEKLIGRENDKQGNILYLPVHNDSISRNTKIKQTPGYEN